MPVTVAVNGMTVVHKDSGGTVSFMPDVCLTPGPPGPGSSRERARTAASLLASTRRPVR